MIEFEALFTCGAFFTCSNPVEVEIFHSSERCTIVSSKIPNKVVMWSFPIVRDGLIYVVDIRNGLYELRYTGPHADEVAGISFLEGNSNLGDAGRLVKSG